MQQQSCWDISCFWEIEGHNKIWNEPCDRNTRGDSPLGSETTCFSFSVVSETPHDPRLWLSGLKLLRPLNGTPSLDCLVLPQMYIFLSRSQISFCGQSLAWNCVKLERGLGVSRCNSDSTGQAADLVNRKDGFNFHSVFSLLMPFFLIHLIEPNSIYSST